MSDNPRFGIYVHWPFCESKCPYCDFNSHVSKVAIDEAEYCKAYDKEMSYMAEIQNTKPTSVFFGGGTPSLMKPKTVGNILESINKVWGIGNIEITLEANPSSVETKRFQGYKTAGVNRISIGVQSLNDKQLKFLGRLHTAEKAINAVNVAKTLFDRVSFDLIYARPNQTADEWKKELGEAIKIADEHLALYQLTIEKNTPFYELHQRKKINMPESEHAAKLYEITGEITEAHGFQAYEISNYAKPGAESIHNLTYWKSGTWAGIGPGAHGRLNTENARRCEIMNVRNPKEWIKKIKNEGNGVERMEELSRQQISDEFLVMGMRLKEGINLNEYSAVGGKKINQEKIKELSEEGLVEISGSQLKTTKKGTMILNAIITELAE